jgi:hypothetical protein
VNDNILKGTKLLSNYLDKREKQKEQLIVEVVPLTLEHQI